ARNNLRAMKKGDQVFFYHSNEGLEIVGIAKVVKEAYQDPTTEDERWSVVDLAPVKKLKRAITLEEIKGDARLQDIALIRQSRLSVMPVAEEEFDAILELSKR
ncbi:MAG: EVE domain-containing protein, partial [Acidobacteria bacterium]|nr:EVE domain-containing protein [Acidobacteriota bacterium]